MSNSWDYNGQVWTSPTVTQVNENFNIGWLYNKTYFENNNGILLFTEVPNLESEKWIIQSNIQNNNEDGIDYSIPWDGIYYIWLCVDNDGVYEPIDSTVQHVGLNTYSNWIKTDKDNYQIDYIEGSDIPQARVVVGYSHMFIGGDVYIMFDNSSMIPYYVGGTPQGELEYNFYNDGLYTVKLIYYLENGDFEVLDEKTFTIGDIIKTEDLPSTQTYPEIIDEIFNDQ
jgi:hypothetical protein